MYAAPFALDDLKKIVSGEISCTEIDYKNSKIKNQALLTYIYNLNLSAVNINVSETTVQERRDLLLSYINHKTSVEVTNLLNTYLKFLFALKNITLHEEDRDDFGKDCLFNDVEIQQLMTNDFELREAVEHAAFVLDGVVVHIMLSVNNLNIQADEEFGQVGVLKDPNWIGNTWINLFKSAFFNAYYYTIMPQLKDLVYFPYQYCESIYKGRVLLDYLSENPWLMAMMQVTLENLESKHTHADTPV